MTAKTIVFGILFVIIMGVLVFAVEFFIPLSAKSDMNICCRKTLLKMEMNGGLSFQTEDDLREELTKKGFSNIVIEGTGFAKYGEEISLNVQVDYVYSRLSGIFTRMENVQHMTYNKFAVARRVVN